MGEHTRAGAAKVIHASPTLASSESLPNANGWVNPYRYDGRDGVRSDTTTGLDWMSVRAYDPTLGRFLARDPLGRAPLVFADNPYVYAGNNPLSNVDPSGQYRAAGFGSTARESGQATNQQMAHIVTQSGCDKACAAQQHAEWVSYHVGLAKGIASQAEAFFKGQSRTLPGFGVIAFGAFKASGVLEYLQKWFDTYIFKGLSIATVGFLMLNTAVISYDLFAIVPQAVFSSQENEGDAFWLDPTNLERDWSIIGLTMTLMGTLLLGVVLPLLMSSLPEFLPVWIAFGVGFLAAIIRLLARAKAFIDQEQQALGYAPS